MIALAYPKESRDVRVLVTEENLVSYGWTFTRIELDLDQLCGYKPAPKKSNPASGEPSFEAGEVEAAPSKKATSSRPSKRTRAASRRPTSSKSTTTLLLPPIGVAEEEEAPPEPLKSRKRSRTESEPAPEVAPTNHPPFGNKDVPASQIGVILESENSQVLPETSLTTTLEGASFKEVAR